MLLDWWLRRFRPDAAVSDIGLASFFVVLDTGVTLVGGSWWPAHPGTLAYTLLGLQALACVSLALRRRAPLTTVAVLAAFSLAVAVLAGHLDALTPAHSGTVWAPYATVVAAYAPVRWCPDRRRALLAVVILTVIVARPWQPSTLVITVGVLRTGLGPLLALYYLTRHELVRALTERAERAEREQHLRAQQARADERLRIAGEMHDVVTHQVNLMVMQAGAMQVSAADAQTRQAADQIRQTGCQALEELRDLVGILRAPPDAGDPVHDQAVLALVEQSRTAGSLVDLFQDGDAQSVSPVVARTAWQIVREALTNSAKHAPGAAVTVRVVYRDGVHLMVGNGPATRPLDPVLVTTGSGLGIATLRRRVEVVHGTLRAGRRPDGGYRVEATLPAYVPTSEAVAAS